MDNMLNVRDVAEKVKKSEQTIRRYIKDGVRGKKLDATNIGREWRIKPDDLQKFIQGEEVAGDV